MKPSLPLAAALVLVADAAHAEVAGATARQMIFEAKLGPFVPLIDRNFAANTGPYHQYFNSEAMLLGEGVLEYQFFQKLGSLAAGLSAGYAEKYAPAIDATTLEKLSQKTGLKLIPMKAYLSYRFDWLAQKLSVPLVPYAKAGLGMTYWSVSNGSNAVEISNDQRGAGMKYGYLGVIGLGLQLDFLDQRLARDFDSSMGVNHTYLFGEFAFQEMTNFGTQASTDLDLSSRHWMFGLAFEF